MTLFDGNAAELAPVSGDSVPEFQVWTRCRRESVSDSLTDGRRHGTCAA